MAYLKAHTVRVLNAPDGLEEYHHMVYHAELSAPPIAFTICRTSSASCMDTRVPRDSDVIQETMWYRNLSPAEAQALEVMLATRWVSQASGAGGRGGARGG